MLWAIIFGGLVLSGIATLVSNARTNYFLVFFLVSFLAAVIGSVFGEATAILALGGVMTVFAWNTAKPKRPARRL